jgi:hypothetical protein
MSEFKHKIIPHFFYLGVLQLFTALFAGIICLLFLRFADDEIYDLILGFLPDVSLLTWSVIGLAMLGIQVVGNVIGAALSLKKLDAAVSIAYLIGGTEMLWMMVQYFVLHIHSVLMILFFLLALFQVILAYMLRQRIHLLNSED